MSSLLNCANDFIRPCYPPWNDVQVSGAPVPYASGAWLTLFLAMERLSSSTKTDCSLFCMSFMERPSQSVDTHGPVDSYPAYY
jgi:hypothetical protein